MLQYLKFWDWVLSHFAPAVHQDFVGPCISVTTKSTKPQNLC